MARLLGVEIPNEKRIEASLPYIYGIGKGTSRKILEQANIDPNARTGELSDDHDALSALLAGLPAGTVSGAPKVRAMQIIDELEPTGRGLYGGTAGYFGIGGDMDQAITIRTLVFNGDEFSLQAGAGIVADSVPANEYQEVLAKSAILRRALEIAGEGL